MADVRAPLRRRAPPSSARYGSGCRTTAPSRSRPAASRGRRRGPARPPPRPPRSTRRQHGQRARWRVATAAVLSGGSDFTVRHNTCTSTLAPGRAVPGDDRVRPVETRRTSRQPAHHRHHRCGDRRGPRRLRPQRPHLLEPRQRRRRLGRRRRHLRLQPRDGGVVPGRGQRHRGAPAARAGHGVVARGLRGALGPDPGRGHHLRRRPEVRRERRRRRPRRRGLQRRAARSPAPSRSTRWATTSPAGRSRGSGSPSSSTATRGVPALRGELAMGAADPTPPRPTPRRRRPPARSPSARPTPDPTVSWTNPSDADWADTVVTVAHRRPVRRPDGLRRAGDERPRDRPGPRAGQHGRGPHARHLRQPRIRRSVAVPAYGSPSVTRR